MLVGFFIAIGGIWAFVAIADEVLEGEAKDFDRWGFLLLRGGEVDPPLWMTEFAYNITALGSVVVLTLTMLLVAGFLALRGQFRRMAFILSAGVLGQSLVFILKLAFGRPRPDLFLHPLIAETSAGFPSGHAMMSAVVYLSIGALVARISPDFKIRDLYSGSGFFAHLPRGPQQDLSRRSLPNRRTRGVVGRSRLGVSMLACGPPLGCPGKPERPQIHWGVLSGSLHFPCYPN